MSRLQLWSRFKNPVAARTVWVNEPRVSVLDCGSPLPLLELAAPIESGRGLPQSKTSRNHPAGFQGAAGDAENAETRGAAKNK